MIAIQRHRVDFTPITGPRQRGRLRPKTADLFSSVCFFAILGFEIYAYDRWHLTKPKPEEAASVGGLFASFAFLVCQNFLVDFKLLDQAFNFLHADLTAHDQPEARFLCQKARWPLLPGRLVRFA